MDVAEVDFDGTGQFVLVQVDDENWERVQNREYKAVRCRHCLNPMMRKAGRIRVHHYAHLSGRDEDCNNPWGSESPEHKLLKWEVADAIRELSGWAAEVEKGEGGKYIADVLATSDEGRRVAFEIQLSPQELLAAQKRDENRAEFGVECVWVSLRGRTGSEVKDITLPDKDSTTVHVSELVETRGLFGSLGFEPRNAELSDVVQDYLTDQIIFLKELNDPVYRSEWAAWLRHCAEQKKRERRAAKEAANRRAEEEERRRKEEEEAAQLREEERLAWEAGREEREAEAERLRKEEEAEREREEAEREQRQQEIAARVEAAEAEARQRMAEARKRAVKQAADRSDMERNIHNLWIRQAAVARAILPQMLKDHPPAIRVGDEKGAISDLDAQDVASLADINQIEVFGRSTYWANGVMLSKALLGANTDEPDLLALVCPVASQIEKCFATKQGRFANVPIYVHTEREARNIQNKLPANLTIRVVNVDISKEEQRLESAGYEPQIVPGLRSTFGRRE